MTDIDYVRVKRIITNADMRQTKGLVTKGYPVFANLRRGEVVLLANRSNTILRFVDSGGGVYTIWAPEGEKFDVNRLVETMNNQLLNISVRAIKGRRCRHDPEPGISTGRVRRRRAA